MNKLFRTLFVLLAMSSQTNASQTQPHRSIDADELLPFTQANRKTSYSKDLAGLYSVKAFQMNQIAQPYNEFAALYHNAIAAQSELEMITERIALESGTSTLSSGIKSQLRAINKINNKLVGNSEAITDLVRTSIVAKDIPALMNAFTLIENETQLVRIKNRFKTPGASGYRDLSLLVRLPGSQIIAEVQLHLEAFSVIKNGKEHDNYEQIQQIEHLQLTENRTLNELELTAIKRIRQESKQLYQQAWSQYLSA